jgi:hypothetical protein
MASTSPSSVFVASAGAGQLIRAVALTTLLCKGSGMAIALALEHPRCPVVLRNFVAGRAPLRTLLDYSTNWVDSLVTEGTAIALEALTFAAIAKLVAPSLGRSLALASAMTDTAAATVLPQLIRPNVALGSCCKSNYGFRHHVLPGVLSTPAAVFGLMQAVRVATRTLVYIGVKHFVKGETYIRPLGVLAQAAGQGAVQGAMAAAAVAATKAVGRTWLGNPSRGGTSLWLWQLTFALSFHASALVAAKAVGELNRRLQNTVIKRRLYFDLAGVNNSRQRLFDLEELQQRFGQLSATELSEVSQFGNEALRSASIDHATRLHAVRFLAALTAYVKAVNAGTLKRRGKMASTTSISFTKRANTASPASSPATISNATMVFPDGSTSDTGPSATSSVATNSNAASLAATTTDADFQSHVFTSEQIEERGAAGNPFRCAKCSVNFVAGDTASVLPCGHILHAGACSQLEVDWCPLCVRPTHSPSNEERMAVFLGMKHYVEQLATEWESATDILPERLHYVEWSYVAQYVRLNKTVEGEVPLDVVPHHFRPGLKAVVDTVLEHALWAYNITPLHAPAQVLCVKAGW